MISCKIHILPHLSSQNLSTRGENAFFFASRKLAFSEVKVLNTQGLKRYYLKSLNKEQEELFFQTFEVLWEDVIKGKGPQDSFWRNSVSSKMQEWENSVGYLAMVLFALAEDKALEGRELVVLPDSFEEAEVWRAWAITHKWTVTSYSFGLVQRLSQHAEHILRTLRLSLIFARKKWCTLDRQVDVKDKASLVVTLFYRRALEVQDYDDQFFGKLHEESARLGNNMVYIGDAIDKLQKGDEKRIGTNKRPLSIYSFISWGDFFMGLRQVWLKAPRFNNCFFKGIDFSYLLTWHARRARYDYNLTAEFFYLAVRRISTQHHFKKMLYAFEGNVYERAAVQGFREAGGSRVDAYSHAVIYPLNLKLFMTSSEVNHAPEPNRYLVCSDYAKKALLRIRPIKAPVISACSLRAIPRQIEKEDSAQEVLVVLDGVWSTSNLLNWLYEHGEALKNYKVIIRPHPNVSGSRLFSQCPQYHEGLFNISKRSLEEDLKRVICVLYRQSSVGVMALMNAIPIIHLNIDLPLCADPLEDMVDGKMSVANEKDLEYALLNISRMRAQLSQEVEGKAVHYFVASSSALIKPFLDVYFLVSGKEQS